MRILPKDLPIHLAKGLAPIYFLFGEEPLQRMEALDSIRASAQKQGYTEREVIDFLAPKDEDRLWTMLNTPSLFSQKRLIECRLKEGKNTKTIQEALQKIILQLPPETILVIYYPDKLDAATLKSKWYITLERHAITVMAAMIPQSKFIAWLSMRAKNLNLIFTEEALLFLSERTEDNLVAASQTLEKIALIFASKPALSSISLEDLAPLITWESRYSIYDLTDALLQGAYTRTFRILECLKNEGIEPSLICWAIAKEVRNLIPLAQIRDIKGHISNSEMDANRIWKLRQALVSTFLDKNSLSFLQDILIQVKNADFVLKTENSKNTWQELQDLCYFCCRGETKCQSV